MVFTAVFQCKTAITFNNKKVSITKKVKSHRFYMKIMELFVSCKDRENYFLWMKMAILLVTCALVMGSSQCCLIADGSAINIDWLTYKRISKHYLLGSK